MRYWLQSGVGCASRFYQGTFKVKVQPELGGCVVGSRGRFASLLEGSVVHSIPGEEDATIAVQHAQFAAERLRASGIDSKLDVTQDPGLWIQSEHD